jgi:hypothetical protein
MNQIIEKKLVDAILIVKYFFTGQEAIKSLDYNLHKTQMNLLSKNNF